MARSRHAVQCLMSVCALAMLFIGCTLKGTTKEITDTTSNVTGTTSGKSWFTGDGLVKQEKKIELFTRVNADNLMGDIASGDGEYAASLAALLGVAEYDRGNFAISLQAQANSLLASQVLAPTRITGFTMGLIHEQR